MLPAACIPCCIATSQCSTRMPPAVDDAVVGAAVAGGVDPLDRGLQLRVADDPVLDLEPGALGEHRVGPARRRRRHRVALDRAAALGHHRAHPSVALEGGELLAAVDGRRRAPRDAPGTSARPARRRSATAPRPRSSGSCSRRPSRSARRRPRCRCSCRRSAPRARPPRRRRGSRRELPKARR